MNLLRLACATSCPLRLRRFHLTCVYCHRRRAQIALRNPKQKRYARDGYSLAPRNFTTIFLAVDNNRRFKTVKVILLQKVISIAEVLAN
jgi:hypothetical protein